MRERLREIRILYRRELRSAFRERNIVINSIILPLVLYPAMIWLVSSGVTFVVGQSENVTSRVMFQNVPAAHVSFRTFLAEQQSIELREIDSPRESLERGVLDLLIEFRDPDESNSTDTTDGRLGVGNFEVGLIYDGSRNRSRTTRSRIEDHLSDYRQGYLLDTAENAGISPREVQQLWVEQKNTASGRDMGRFILGLLVPVVMIVMLAVGGMYPAIDSTAGERENQTWETLMTVSANRSSIVIAKYLYVATMSFAAGMLNLLAMSLSLGSLLRSLGDIGTEDLSTQLPIGAIPVIAMGAALMALFIAAGMMILASFARTFKEGQSLVGPFYIAIFLPVLFLQAPDIEFTAKLAAIPIVNVVMMFREAFAGVYQWQLIGITVGVEALTIGLALFLANKILQYEDFVLGGFSGNFGRFLKQRLLGRAS